MINPHFLFICFLFPIDRHTTMNKHSSQDQHLLTKNEWWSTNTDRAALWKNFVFQNMSISWELEYWFYWMAYFTEPQLRDTITALEKAPTKDVRYRDQIQQMATYVKDVLFRCRGVLIAQRSRCFCTGAKFPCQYYRNRFKCDCFSWHMTQVGCLRMCDNAKHALKEDVAEVMNAFMDEWLHEYYYVWKMSSQGRIHFPVVVNIHPMSLSDIRFWEVVCEDDDKQILSHPLLSHPSDFLEKRVVDMTSTLYVDKARFEYQIPGSLSKYPVVLSKQPSIIPRMASAPFSQKPEKYLIQCQESRQVLYTESTTTHKNAKQPHKKRRLSKILKEGRKKNKTLWTRHRRSKNPFRQFLAVDDGEDYYGVYDDYEYYFQNWKQYSCGRSSYDDYDRYDDYDDYDLW